MAQDVSGSSSVPPENSDVDEEFKFLLCQNCHQEAERPNLLSCLHNLCAECLQETTLGNRCPVCQAPHSQTNTTFVRPNSFFADLRTKLGVFRKISRGQELACDNCGKEGTHWCFDCEEFLCSACFANHQRYLKKQSHEARAMEDLRASSSKEFLSESKNASIMSCSTKEHRLERLSIYCKVCQRPLCCTCALLDYGHSSHHCHIQEEIQRRQREMLSMSSNLGEMETAFETSCGELRDKVDRMVEEKDKTREQIRQRVTEMVQLVEKKGEMFLAAVEDEHRRKVQEVEETLQNGERVGQRLASGRQLVDTMRLYASDQEVLDMYPFVWKSLEELARRHYPWEQEAERKETLRGSRSGYPDFLRKSDDRERNSSSCSHNSIQSETFREVISEEETCGKHFSNSDKTSYPRHLQPAERISVPYRLAVDLGMSQRFEEVGRDQEDKPANSGGSVSPLTDPASCLSRGTVEDISSHGEPSELHPAKRTPTQGNSKDGFHPPIPGVSQTRNPAENALHLVAVKDETKCFSVIIHPGGYERGLESFLHYLRTLHQPILVGYNLWSMNLALLVKYLEALRKGEAFRDAIFGFLDASPLIKEKLPNRRSYTLKSLYHDSFEELLDNDQPLECAKALEELCTVLEADKQQRNGPVAKKGSNVFQKSPVFISALGISGESIEDMFTQLIWQPIYQWWRTYAQCGEAQVVVAVKRDLFGTGRLIQAADLSLGSSGCKHTSLDAAKDAVVFDVGLHECGSTLQMTPDSLVYNIILHYKPTPASNAVVIRTSPVEVPIECHYPRKSNVSSKAIQPTWIPFSSTLSAEQKLSFTLRLMNDDWSSERTSNAYQLGDVMNIQANVNGENHVALRLFVDSCVATLTPQRDSSPQYAIIDYNGWVPVEGTRDICNCCENRNCGPTRGQPGRVNPWGSWASGRRVGRDVAAKQDTQKKEVESDVTVGPVFIVDAYMASKRSLGHQSQALEVPAEHGDFSTTALLVGLALMSVAMVLALALTVVLLAKKHSEHNISTL
uniref:Uncharacterized protein n=1 Tax=Sphaerodactylus townsendi TaxID=933632 RepID=A0ACB8E5X4_9SAUR